MCKVIDDILPVVGAVVGSFIMPGVGTAIGAGLGGMAGNYAQTHNFGNALGAGAISGATAFAGGSLGSALGGLGAGAAGDATTGFATDLASNMAPETLGGLESGAGGAAMFGANAGTGTAIGDASGALGGNGLGIAGGGALSGISDSPSYLGALGGGTQGTGLGIGGQGASDANLAGAMGSPGDMTGNSIPNGVTQTGVQAPASPMSSMGNMQAGTGVTNPTSTGVTQTGLGVGSDTSTGSSGSPFSGSMEGTQAASMPNQQGLSTMYGPESTADGSPMGMGIANSQPGQGVQFGALGEGTSAAPGTAASQGGGVNDFLSALFGNGQQGGGQMYPGQLSPWLGLAKAGLGAYQQHAQQSANDNYTHQIDSMFSPNSPYAQQMQQTLGRQDAALGRNSQYGSRAVQLAAALSQAHANALGNSNYAHAATATPGASMLNSLFSTFANPQYAQGLSNLGSSAFNGLSSLFG